MAISAAQQAINHWSGIYGVPTWITDSIATAESGLNPQAQGDFNAQTGYTSFGLFQLHQHGGQGDGYSVQQLENPDLNAQVGIAPMAPAYQAGVKKGLSGYPLLQYVADHSGHPSDTGTMPSSYNQQLAQAYQKVTGKTPSPIGAGSGAGSTVSSSSGGILGSIQKVFLGLLGGGVAIAGIWVVFKS